VSLFSILGVGASGLRAATVGVNVTSQNATNAATPGYSRREVVQDPLPGPPLGGNGVATRGPVRTVDRFVERRLLGASAAHAEASARLSALGPLDDAFSASAGLGSALDAFQNAIQALTAAPSDGPTRSQVLSSASALADAFQRTASTLTTARSDADAQITDQVSTANGLLTQIDSLQQQIKKSELGGVEASDLRDQRDQRIRDLAKIVPINVVDGAHGAVNVLLEGGMGLVSADGGTALLGTKPNATTGALDVTVSSAGAAAVVTDRLTGGTVGGLIHARDQELPAASAKLDQLAYDIATSYSAAHASGVGLDGGTGRALFSTSATATGAATSFAVSTDVLGHPERIAAGTDPTLVSGDNRNALALSALATTSITTGGTRTAGDALSDLIATSGEAVQSAKRDSDVLGAAESQATALRSSISGVSSDDEMVALTQFQRAYDASAKVVQAADQMLQTLIAMKT